MAILRLITAFDLTASMVVPVASFINGANIRPAPPRKERPPGALRQAAFAVRIRRSNVPPQTRHQAAASMVNEELAHFATACPGLPQYSGLQFTVALCCEYDAVVESGSRASRFS